MNFGLPASAFTTGANFMNGWQAPPIAAPAPELLNGYAPINAPKMPATWDAFSVTNNKPAGLFGIEGLGKNMGTLNLALGGLQTLGGLWGAYQAQKLAKAQFNYTKDVTEANLANNIKSFNTALEDRARSRAVVEGQSQQQTDDYIARNRLSR